MLSLNLSRDLRAVFHLRFDMSHQSCTISHPTPHTKHPVCVLVETVTIETHQKKGEGAQNRDADAMKHYKNPAGSRCRASREQCMWRLRHPWTWFIFSAPFSLTLEILVLDGLDLSKNGVSLRTPLTDPESIKSLLRSSGNSTRPGGPTGEYWLTKKHIQIIEKECYCKWKRSTLKCFKDLLEIQIFILLTCLLEVL